MRIKLILASAFVALIAFASCKKSTVTKTVIENDTLKIPDTANYAISEIISADVNGVGDTATIPDYYEHYIDNIGSNASNAFDFDEYDSANNRFYLQVETLNNSITAKTYGAFGDSTTVSDVEFYQSGTGWYYGSTVLNPNTVTITSIIGTTLKGTFQGTIYLNGDTTQTGSNKKVVTNGKFAITLY
jgi:hypothetical protein